MFFLFLNFRKKHSKIFLKTFHKFTVRINNFVFHLIKKIPRNKTYFGKKQILTLNIEKYHRLKNNKKIEIKLEPFSNNFRGDN